MTSEVILKVGGLSGGYGDVIIVRDMDFSIEKGACLCVTGRNGVGKTTLARLLSGTIPVASGHIELNGRDMSGLPAFSRNRMGFGYAPQENVVFGDLSVRDNLLLHLHDTSLDRYDGLFGSFPRIRERLDQRAGTLSGGERKLLSFCRVMAQPSPFALLDEPTEGVQPENISLMADAIRGGMDAGRSFLVIEQNLTLVEAIATEVMVMDHGRSIHTAMPGPNLREDLADQMRL